MLGMTYRPGVPEIRKSPAVDVARILSRVGAEVCGFDPFADRIADELETPVVRPERFESVAPEADAAVLVTPHEEFEAIDWGAIPGLVVVDGRDALDLSETDHRVSTVGDGGR